MTETPRDIGAKWVATDRVFPTATTCAINGTIRVQWGKMLWLISNGCAGVIGVVWFASIEAFIVFLVMTAVTICAGHSVGMHRLLIHRRFQTYRGIEYLLVWLGTLVGMAGPFGMIKAHDMRDWHQRQTVCPPHPSHAAGIIKDAYWQLCCTYDLSRPPILVIEKHVKTDKVYHLMERLWMVQQIPVACILFGLGGWGWLLWGCCLRVFVSLVGHWLVGHFAHRKGAPVPHGSDLSVQGYNLPYLGLLTFGENWHGNHHAFPNSAQLGIGKHQLDPGYLFIMALKTLGLAWGIKLPTGDQPQSELRGLSETSRS